MTDERSSLMNSIAYYSDWLSLTYSESVADAIADMSNFELEQHLKSLKVKALSVDPSWLKEL